MRLWALTPTSVARTVVDLAVRLPLTALEVVLGDGLNAALRERPRPPAPVESAPEPRFSRQSAG